MDVLKSTEQKPVFSYDLAHKKSENWFRQREQI